MPFIEAEMDADYEDKPVAEGLYDLRIVRATDKQSRNSKADMVECIIEIVGANGAAPIFHYLVMPISTKQAKDRGVEPDDTDKKRNKMRNLTRFLQLFGIKFEKDGFNTEDLVGADARQVTVTQRIPEGWDSPTNSIKLPAVG